MANRPTQADILRELATLHEQMATLSARVDVLAVRPMSLWEHLTLDRHPVHMDGSNLASVLRYHERATRRGPIIYYALVGALYLRAALAIFVGTSSLYLLSEPWRAVVVGFYFLVGLGNFSCILIPTRHNQMQMIGPTVFAAVVILILSIYGAVTAQEQGAIISLICFWVPMIIGHIAWGLSVPGRVDQLTFTHRLLTASQAQEESP